MSLPKPQNRIWCRAGPPRQGFGAARDPLGQDLVPGGHLCTMIWCQGGFSSFHCNSISIDKYELWGLGPRCRYGPHRPQPSQQYCQTLSATRNVHLFRCVTQGFRKTSLAIASALFTQQWPHPAPPVLLERSSVKLPRSTRVRKLPRRCYLHLRATIMFATRASQPSTASAEPAKR